MDMESPHWGIIERCRRSSLYNDSPLGMLHDLQDPRFFYPFKITYYMHTVRSGRAITYLTGEW